MESSGFYYATDEQGLHAHAQESLDIFVDLLYNKAQNL